MGREFVFGFDTSVVEAAGNFFSVLVTVYPPGDFEIWDPDRGIPVDFASLPKIDQAQILEKVQERVERRASAGAVFR